MKMKYIIGIIVAFIFMVIVGVMTAIAVTTHLQQKPAEPKQETTTSTPTPVKEEKVAKPTMSKAEKDAKITELSKGLEVTKDDMRGIIFYSVPTKSVRNRTIWVAPYIARIDEKNHITLFDNTIYHGDNWIFYQTIFLRTANDRYRISYQKFTAHQEVLTGDGVVETYNIPMTEEAESTWRKALTSPSIRIRFTGENGSQERDLTTEEIQLIKRLFDLYDVLRA